VYQSSKKKVVRLPRGKEDSQYQDIKHEIEEEKEAPFSTGRDLSKEGTSYARPNSDELSVGGMDRKEGVGVRAIGRRPFNHTHLGMRPCQGTLTGKCKLSPHPPTAPKNFGWGEIPDKEKAGTK
jgi:hypothetical protein